MKIVLASGNRGKLAELGEMLAPLGVTLQSQAELGIAPAPEEGLTFVENALDKARHASAHSGLPAIADDSGLAVDALGGAPGVYSARYAGVHGDDAANNRKLLADLEGRKDRGAAFVCVLALCGPGGGEWLIRGECRGHLTHAPAGNNGFGYDPLFVPDGYDRTFAELGAEVKNRISHRSAALRNLMSHPDNPLARFRPCA